MMTTWLVMSLEMARPARAGSSCTSPSLTTQDATSDFEQANNLFRQGSLDEALTAWNEAWPALLTMWML